jgi:4-carboxymuconolactone decarboxylase
MFLTGVAAFAQKTNLPADIDPQSHSRLPLLKRDQIPAEGLHVWDAVAGKDSATPPLGPVATSVYSLGVAGPMNDLNKYIRNVVVGPAIYQICSLLAAREYDEPYEWNSHEGGARRSMVDPKTIDAIKFNKSVDGLPEKEALVVRFGRALLRDHNVSSELYADVVKMFGQQGMYEITAAIGDYVMVAIMLRAVDQHVPGEAANPLPALGR